MEEVVRLVREAEALLAQGKPVEEVCRGLGISESSLVRWRHKYGGLSSPEAKRLKELERENSDLKHIVAELELDRRILKAAMKHLGKA
jgi:transposase-like protein